MVVPIALLFLAVLSTALIARSDLGWDIPDALLIAIVGTAVLGTAAYGIGRLVRTLDRRGPGNHK